MRAEVPKQMNNNSLRQWYIDHNICVACGQRDAFNGRQKCPECLEKAIIQNMKYRSLERERSYYPRRKEKREQRIADGLCPICGKPAAKGQLCLEHFIKRRRKRETEKMEREIRGDPRRIRVENGLCWFCSEQALPEKRVCQKHYDMTMKKFHGKEVSEDHPWKKVETARLKV